ALAWGVALGCSSAPRRASISGGPGAPPGPPLPPPSAPPAPHRPPPQAAMGRQQRHALAPPPLEPEGGDDGRDILIEALANFVGCKVLAGCEQRNADRGDDFAGRERVLAIAGDE